MRAILKNALPNVVLPLLAIRDTENSSCDGTENDFSHKGNSSGDVTENDCSHKGNSSCDGTENDCSHISS